MILYAITFKKSELHIVPVLKLKIYRYERWYLIKCAENMQNMEDNFTIMQSAVSLEIGLSTKFCMGLTGPD